MNIGSLCSGYEGLGMAVQAVLGGELAFVADNDPGASAILAHRFPSLPNLDDISAADWSAVEPVDVLTAGFPCQDVSCAGGRAGLREGNRTGVWAYVARAIDALRPSLVVLENVRGLLSAGADSDMEFCPWCLGESGTEHALRACGAVLGDLADLGYDARWEVVSAADAGAPHRRERVFIIARPTADAERLECQRRRNAGVLGSATAAESGEGLQRERAGDSASYSGTATPADAERDGQSRWTAGSAGETDERRPRSRAEAAGRSAATADSAGVRLPLRQPEHLRRGGRAAASPDGRDTAEHDRIAHQGSPHAQDADGAASSEWRQSAPGQATPGRPRADAGGPGRAPTTADAAGIGRQRHHEPPPSTLTGSHGLDLGPAIGALLPTPSAQNSHGNQRRGGERSGELLLPGAVMDLLPTPRATDTGTPGRRASEGFRPPLSEVLLQLPLSLED